MAVDRPKNSCGLYPSTASPKPIIELLSTGDTELTWSAGPAIGYTFGRSDEYRVTAGYRRMDIDFETAEPVDADMSMSGMWVGFRVNF